MSADPWNEKVPFFLWHFSRAEPYIREELALGMMMRADNEQMREVAQGQLLTI